LEKVIAKAAKLKSAYKLLKTVPGIWNLLAQMIMLETGPIEDLKKWVTMHHIVGVYKATGFPTVSQKEKEILPEVI
jgi:hypothetical protein